jgi:NAD(P)-dependent dehydrogenase (short-subunit alcohol dehydrogenase family)
MSTAVLERPLKSRVHPIHQELESNTAKHQVLLLGAGSGLGESLAMRLSKSYRVIAGMRSGEHFEALRQNINQIGGIEPAPLLADITDFWSFKAAFDDLKLSPEVKLHFMPLAAGGLDYRPVNMALGRQMIRMRRMVDRGEKIPRQVAEEATAAIKEVVTKPEALEAARRINVEAPLNIFSYLEYLGHLDPASVIVNTSSSISDEADPAHPELFRGPWFYYTVAISKKAGVLAFQNMARRYNRGHLDAVAPELTDTLVGQRINELESLLEHLHPSIELFVPRITRGEAADAIVADLKKLFIGDARIRTLYIDRSGTGNTRPSTWDKPMVPYL